MKHNQNMIAAIYHQRAILLWPFLTFSSVAKINGRCWEVILAVWGHALEAVAVVKRFEQKSMYGLSVGTKKWRLSEVAVSGGSIQFISVYCFTLKMYKKQENLNILKS